MSHNLDALGGKTKSTHRGFGADAARDRGVSPGQVGEGPLTRMMEEQTSRVPSDFWLFAACGSIAASLACKMAGHKHEALFVGQWAPTFLILGLYNKLVKQHGSD